MPSKAIWLRGLLAEITGKEETQVEIKVDNKSAIALIRNPVFHGRSKHIDTRYHFIRESVEKEQIRIEYVCGDEQKADILTKALPRVKFEEMKIKLGLKDVTSLGSASRQISEIKEIDFHNLLFFLFNFYSDTSISIVSLFAKVTSSATANLILTAT
ncbi:hypothetical protein E3N88_34108 [Mikania micrantha]|uniref:Reverse transcriptase Ty1/copia-type domain-containing protein n=1 Tax=Mikania micrantha TaxID=192012 RepID=A0A5N6MDL1_9ASTR|nr:hypothetical protein E3N88_34108 [Mikania micrantha]